MLACPIKPKNTGINAFPVQSQKLDKQVCLQFIVERIRKVPYFRQDSYSRSTA